MIQLATDPTTSRTGFRAATGDEEQGKTHVFETRRSRSGHAWPFPSRYAASPVRKDSQKPAACDSGS